MGPSASATATIVQPVHGHIPSDNLVDKQDTAGDRAWTEQPDCSRGSSGKAAQLNEPSEDECEGNEADKSQPKKREEPLERKPDDADGAPCPKKKAPQHSATCAASNDHFTSST